MNRLSGWKAWLALGLLIAFILCCGAMDAFFGQMNYMSDGVSYLDLSNAMRAGHWKIAVSPLWSFGYPLLLAVFRPFFPPSALGEWYSFHTTNFFLFCVAFLAYLFCAGELKSTLLQEENRTWNSVHWVLALAVFLALELSFDRASRATPDMFVSALVFLTTGLLLRLGTNAKLRIAFLLGLVCGIGYLVKTIYLPFSLACIVLTIPLAMRTRRFATVTSAFLGFVLIAAPYIASMSWSYGHFTIGESGALNYAWRVNHLRMWANWQGGPAGYGTPIHPTHQAMSNPPVYTYGGVFPVTYPPFFDPPYFYEGYRHFLKPRAQFHAFLSTGHEFAKLLAGSPFSYGAVLGAVLLLLWNSRPKVKPESTTRVLYFALPSLLLVALYMTVDIEARYVSGFLAIFALVGLMFLSTRRDLSPARVKAVASLLLATALLSAALTEGDCFRMMLQGERPQNDPQWRIARSLTAAGLRPGDKMAVILGTNAALATWAHVAGVYIVGEIDYGIFVPDRENLQAFWSASPQVQQQVLDIYRRSGATAVLAEKLPGMPTPEGWSDTLNSSFIFRSLR